MNGRNCWIPLFRLVGWTRFDSKATSSSQAGSIQSEVPVYPRCPNARAESRVPEEDGGDGVSQPSPQLDPGGRCCRLTKRRTKSTGSKASCPRELLNQARETAKTADAVPNRPAWPAIPPIAYAFSSCT